MKRLACNPFCGKVNNVKILSRVLSTPRTSTHIHHVQKKYYSLLNFRYYSLHLFIFWELKQFAQAFAIEFLNIVLAFNMVIASFFCSRERLTQWLPWLVLACISQGQTWNGWVFLSTLAHEPAQSWVWRLSKVSLDNFSLNLLEILHVLCMWF